MKSKEYILLIMNCVKYKEKAQRQKDGWLKDIPPNLIYYHVIGDESLATEYKFDEENRILYVKTPDDYNSLPYKVISAYAAIDAEYTYKYVFKTDDDQHLTQPHLLKEWMNDIQIHTPNYGGRLITIHNDHISEYYHFHPELPRNVLMRRSQYCNGRFYILSKIAIQDLLKKRDFFRKEYFEDYAVGYYMDFDIKSRFMHIQNDVFVDNI